jgi:hypothetical protein
LVDGKYPVRLNDGGMASLVSGVKTPVLRFAGREIVDVAGTPSGGWRPALAARWKVEHGQSRAKVTEPCFTGLKWT